MPLLIIVRFNVTNKEPRENINRYINDSVLERFVDESPFLPKQIVKLVDRNDFREIKLTLDGCIVEISRVEISELPRPSMEKIREIEAKTERPYWATIYNEERFEYGLS